VCQTSFLFKVTCKSSRIIIEIEILLAAGYFAFCIFKFHFTSASNSRRRAYKGKERRVTFPVRLEIFMESDGARAALSVMAQTR
jgi:hypothetical protein